MRAIRDTPTSGVVPVPNAFFDVLLPVLTDSELRVYLVVVRATLGWREGSDRGGWQRKRRDWLSHSQLVKRTGRRSEAVSGAVDRLVRRELIIVEDREGKPLNTAELRRRHMGRLYFRLGATVDMWKTAPPCHTAQPKTTTYKQHNRRIYPTVPTAATRRSGCGDWHRVTVIKDARRGS